MLNTELQYCFSNAKILLNKIPILGIKGKKYTILSKVQKFDAGKKNMLTLIYDCDQKMTYDAGFFLIFSLAVIPKKLRKLSCLLLLIYIQTKPSVYMRQVHNVIPDFSETGAVLVLKIYDKQRIYLILKFSPKCLPNYR